jgi:O-antigen ligase
MQTHTFTFESRDSTSRPVVYLPGAAATIFRFWLPLAAVAVAVFAAQHSFHYATFSFVEGTDDVDLVADIGSSSHVRQLSFIVLGSLGAVLLTIPSAVPVTMDRRLMFLLLALCCWIVLSAFWSEDPELSIKRSLAPVLSVIAAWGIAKHWQPRQLCLFCVLISGFFVLLGVAAEIRSGAFLAGDEYRFSGTLHPNDQAVNCAILCLASLSLLGRSPRCDTETWRWLWIFSFVVGQTLLLLTRSRTATGAFLAALFVFYYLGTSGKARVFATGCMAMIAAMMAIVIAESGRGHQNLFVNILTMGRDQGSDDITSLTGRIPIWDEVIYDIANRPLGGYGYGSFWTPQRVLSYSYIHEWEFTHAHSAYFETLLNVGVVGLGLGLLLVMTALWSAVQHYKFTDDCTYRFVAALITLALIHGLADSNFVILGFAPLVGVLCISMVAMHRAVGHRPQTYDM